MQHLWDRYGQFDNFGIIRSDFHVCVDVELVIPRSWLVQDIAGSLWRILLLRMVGECFLSPRNKSCVIPQSRARGSKVRTTGSRNGNFLPLSFREKTPKCVQIRETLLIFKARVVKMTFQTSYMQQWIFRDSFNFSWNMYTNTQIHVCFAQFI